MITSPRTASSHRSYRLWPALLIGLLLAMPTTPLLAQPSRQGQPADVGSTPSSTKGYTMSYLLTIVLVAGGLATVCRPSFRRAEQRRDFVE